MENLKYEDFLCCECELLDNFLEQNKNILYKKNINMNNVEFIIVYNIKNIEYDNDDLISMFRSVIYVKLENKYKIINYTYNNLKYITTIPYLKKEDEIYESYEGTNVVVFNYNNIWYYATSKCLNMFESKFNSTLTHGDMFKEIIVDLDEFEKNLNKEYNYNFLIIHHKNKFINEYNELFGNNYKKLVFTNAKYQDN